MSISYPTLLSSLSNNNTGCKDLPCEQSCTYARTGKLSTVAILANLSRRPSRTRQLNSVAVDSPLEGSRITRKF